MKGMLFKVGIAFVGATLSLGLIEYNPAQALTLDTAPSWDGSNSISRWGVMDTSTYGQTFTVTGPDNVLQDFSFQIGTTSSPIPFAAYVAEWNGGLTGNIVGSLLYNSGLQSFSNAGPGFSQVSFNTGGIQLNTGSKYVAFLSTSGFQSGQPISTTVFGGSFFGADDYADGEFVFYNTSNDFAPLLNSNWETFGNFGDAAFKANLTSSNAVPTPALLPGLIGMAAAAYRKRRSETANPVHEA
jgi:hypothetical protein